jgi:hypothetical protein
MNRRDLDIISLEAMMEAQDIWDEVQEELTGLSPDQVKEVLKGMAGEEENGIQPRALLAGRESVQPVY